MSKKLFSQVLVETSDNLSLPERIIQAIEIDRETKADFLQVITLDGERLYSVRDWVFYISGSKNKQRFAPWKDLKRSLLEAANSSEGVETFKVSEFLTALDVETAGGKQEMEFTTEEGLYQITQRMSDRSKAVRDIKTFLAQSGVFMGEAYTNPEGAAGQLERLAYNREYRKLLEEGFSAEEAQQWLDVRGKQKRQRCIVTAIWRERGISKPNDYADLTNQVHRVALGRTATRHKRELDVKDSPRNYVSAADNATLQITEFTSALLHEHRESFGKPELSEDIDDVRPIIDAARPEIQKVFSKKPRRLSTGEKPKLVD